MQINPGRKRALSMAALALCSGLVSGCGLIEDGGQIEEFTVGSRAFSDLKEIPTRYACSAYGGDGKTLPLHWSGVPDARAFAVVVDDPDARDGTYIHWVLVNLDGTTTNMVEGGDPPEKALVGENSAKARAYAPPCPPKGQRHRYRYTVYALEEPVPAGEVGELKDTLPAIADRTVAMGRITGYLGERPKS